MNQNENRRFLTAMMALAVLAAAAFAMAVITSEPDTDPLAPVAERAE